MAESIKQIKIFISSPSDVCRERRIAQRVIEELNSSFCVANGIVLIPQTWEKNTYPAVGEYSQDVINKQIGVYDLFVGIMANRFGTPTGKADSGTEEEFNIAYENRENTHIMFFFKDAPIKPSSLDQKQYKKVTSFMKKIGRKGVYYKQFSKGFEKMFRECLTQYLTDKYIKITAEDSDDAKVSPKAEQIKIDFDKYLNSYNPTYEKYCYINALAIPNSQFKLKRIYVAQTIEKENRSDEDAEQEVIKINQLPVDLINKYKKILIKDTAGMGKSTIMKFMFIDLIDNQIKDVGIPIYIELNRLNKNRTILKEIQEELKFLSIEVDNDSLIKMIQKGNFVFFLDGYDEISIANKDEVRDDIRNLIIDAGKNNNFILTSRPEDTLTSFGDFQSFKIQPLTREEAFELLSKYDQDKQKKVSEELIKELQTRKYRSIDEYLENPLLVSLLYSAFNYKAEIPLKKHLFYRQVYDALYNTHKLAQGQKPHEKRSGLDIDDFNRVLRYVGYECLRRVGVQFDEDTILGVIQEAKDFCCNLIFGNSAFLQDLLISVPLFSKDGTEYKWAHKSLMEYFAARYIADDSKQDQDIILKAIYDSQNFDKYENVLDLYYDIDTKGFMKNIMLQFGEAYIKYHDEHYPTNLDIDNELIESRIGLMFRYRKIGLINLITNDAQSDLDFMETCNLLLEQYNIDAHMSISHHYGGKVPFIKNLYIIKSSNLRKYSFLYSLLKTKAPELFKDIEYFKCYKKQMTISSLFEDNRLYWIDMKTGDDNYQYCKINRLIFGYRCLYSDYYFNYEELKKMINKLHAEAKNSCKIQIL